MNFIFGIIILAMFILAVRVIWASALQCLAMIKTGMAAVQRYRMQRSARHSITAVMPRIRHEVDWEVMSDTVRREIQQRNSGLDRELERLERQYQAKQKTIKLYEADIEIAKLERELSKIKPLPTTSESESKPRRRSKNKSAEIGVDDKSSKTARQVLQLREALKGNVNALPINQQARH
jgi:hypothetical protein